MSGTFIRTGHLGASMCFVDDQIETVCFGFSCVANSFPDRVSALITSTRSKQFVFAQLLCINEINLATDESFTVEVCIHNDKIAITQLC